MAFTDVETAQVHDAVKMDPTGEDLCKLGLLYSTGQCGVIDYVEAHKWFNLASLMGSDTIPLARHDIVFAPRTAIAEINDFTELYIRNILPLDNAFAYALADQVFNSN
ncbi:MAG: hypothetical protein JKP96_13615 [Oceanicaulis sp.]|nr:hypothetical protein [Oceanicaulis sp.]